MFMMLSMVVTGNQTQANNGENAVNYNRVDEEFLVSVIIPTHNRASLLRRAITSVLEQTYNNLEVIIVDDASNDETRKIISNIQDERIQYIRHKTNKGGSAARNSGIRAATGEYIAFLDDDDEWEPKKTEEQMKVLQKYDAVLCTSDESTSGMAKHESRKTINQEDLRRGHFTAGGTGVLMTRAHVLKEIMFDESLPRYQDWDVFIRISQKYTIGYLNKPYVRYNEGPHNRISNKIINLPIPQLEEQLHMVKKHKEFFGRKWFKRHMCSAMLYGIKYRPDKIRHLLFMVKQYGVASVFQVLVRRFARKMCDIL